MLNFYLVLFGIFVLVLILRSEVSAAAKIVILLVVTGILLWFDKPVWSTDLLGRMGIFL